MKYRRIFTIVIDSFGIGAMDNAAEYGDTGCDTFGHIADKVPEIKSSGCHANSQTDKCTDFNAVCKR